MQLYIWTVEKSYGQHVLVGGLGESVTDVIERVKRAYPVQGSPDTMRDNLEIQLVLRTAPDIYRADDIFVHSVMH